MKKMKGIVLIAAVAVLLLPVELARGQTASRAIDLAAQKAAVSLVEQLRSSELPSMRIAFLPLFGKDDQSAPDVYPIIRAELNSKNVGHEFYARNEEEWNKLVSEIEFGQKRADVMDAATIQKFGAVKGVQALLYGEVREASFAKDGSAVVRLAMFLGEVETGRELWSANAMGELKPDPSDRIVELAIDNAKIIAAVVVGLIVLGLVLRATTRPR